MLSRSVYSHLIHIYIYIYTVCATCVRQVLIISPQGMNGLNTFLSTLFSTLPSLIRLPLMDNPSFR